MRASAHAMPPRPSPFAWKTDAMNDTDGYVVFLFDQALEALGDAIKPYLREGPGGPHLLCNEVDTAGSLIELTIQATTQEGHAFSLELMFPQNMVKMIVSARSDASFGFSPRVAPALMAALPTVAAAPPHQGAVAPDAPDAAKAERSDLPPEG
jgi:hypothetical protein